MNHRRKFLKLAAAATAIQVMPGVFEESVAMADDQNQSPPFRISLAQWSLRRTLRDEASGLTNLDFPMFARKECDIDAIEWVSTFFDGNGADEKYLDSIKQRCDDHGVKNLLIMVDREGGLGNPNQAARNKAVMNHHKWVDAAKYLGCHSIRVNARSQGSYTEQMNLAADGLRRLAEYAKPLGINVLVENHGGLSSNAAWLAVVIERVGMDNCGTLPDFGNFTIVKGDSGETFDKYQGVQALMPYAKAVSAKLHQFDEAGNETSIDCQRMMKIVTAAGYHGYVGIEWVGSRPDELAGIRQSKALLERIQKLL